MIDRRCQWSPFVNFLQSVIHLQSDKWIMNIWGYFLRIKSARTAYKDNFASTLACSYYLCPFDYDPSDRRASALTCIRGHGAAAHGEVKAYEEWSFRRRTYTSMISEFISDWTSRCKKLLFEWDFFSARSSFIFSILTSNLHCLRKVMLHVKRFSE